MNVECTCAQRRMCIGTDKKSAACPKQAVCQQIFITVQLGTTDDPIIPIVLTTLNVLIERANLGTILCRRKSSLLLGSKLEKPFSQLSVPLNLSYVHHIL
jgi:hypothetical protein